MSTKTKMKFKKVSNHLVFTTGEKTCAYSKGEFCRFFSVKNFGQVAFCTLYQLDLKLDPETLVTLRCDECINEFPPKGVE